MKVVKSVEECVPQSDIPNDFPTLVQTDRVTDMEKDTTHF